MSIEFELTFEPSDDDAAHLAQGLNNHAIDQLGEDGFRPVAILVRDNGVVLGGITGFLNWNWLQISLLWVDEQIRGEGLGSQLVERIETAARNEGCTHAHVSTFSFQATGFYKSQGYRNFATLEDYPPGQAKHFLRKDL